MKTPVSDIAFTPAVKTQQERLGSRRTYARVEENGGWSERIDANLEAFIAERDSFYLGTASADGQPYIQHRGGAKGFLKVLDASTLAFADYAGNRQYISMGNLSENDQAYLFLMDWYRNCGLVEESKGRHISKMFKKSLRSIGADEKKHFHSLRHTFAVRRILQNYPIYKVQRLMGHSSVTTTEVYLNMDLKRVKQDFPTIVSSYPESPKSLIRDTDFRDTKEIKTPFLVGEMVY